MQEYSVMKLLEDSDFAKDVTTRRSVFSLINKYNGVFFIRKLNKMKYRIALIERNFKHIFRGQANDTIQKFKVSLG